MEKCLQHIKSEVTPILIPFVFLAQSSIKKMTFYRILPRTVRHPIFVDLVQKGHWNSIKNVLFLRLVHSNVNTEEFQKSNNLKNTTVVSII